jgi:hypothetical protein
MTTEATTYTRDIRRHTPSHTTLIQAHLLWRTRSFLFHSDWDELMLAQEGWIDKFCIGVIIVASLFFIPPILVILFFR